MTKPKTKNKGGRPKTYIDYALVERLSKMQCTEYEIASALDMTPDGFRKRKQKDEELVWSYIKGRGAGKESLRRSQWKLAEAGNATMLIWLGKQYLGQRDKADLDQTTSVIVNIIKPNRSLETAQNA